MDIEKVGQFIKELRVENNLSQNQLSEEIHVTRQAISNWENGKALPDSNVLLMLSNLFKVSINEILSGRRLTKEDNLEEIALQLVDENNQKRNKIKKMMISFSTILSILVIIFLGYYFVTNYNSIKVYRVSGKSDIFKTNEGILVTTRNKTYLHLGAVEKIKKDDKAKVNKVILYYKDNNKKIIIYEKETTNYLIKEIGNYNEFSLSNNKNNLYLEVKYDNNKSDIIKLKLKEDFKNNFIKHNNNKKIKVIKEEPKPKVKKEVFEKVNNNLSLAQEKIGVDNFLRRDEEMKNNEKNDPEQETQQVISNDLNQEVTEVQKEKEDNLYYELPTEYDEEPDNNTEVNELNEINYEALIQIIREYGIKNQDTYTYENFNENEYIYISEQDNNINIFISNDAVMESWIYIFSAKSFNYQKFINYDEVDNIIFYQDSESESDLSLMKKFQSIIESIKNI